MMPSIRHRVKVLNTSFNNIIFTLTVIR
ncbi:hypothetical protein V12B01_13660 [Vibrio splendidus 12B01]|nr:hypothetical protein V12B01_13660 [Vibrio splendidus 12B01]